MSEGKKYQLKVVVVGDPAVGKTSLIRRFADDKFEDEYKHTIGADFNVKVIEYPEVKKNAVLTVWDIGGQERFEIIRRYYYEGSHAGFIVFDLTNKDAFKHVLNWYNDLREYLKDIPIALLANKLDLEDNIVISDSEIEEKLKELKIEFYLKTSAKTGENVEKAFSRLAKIKLEELS
ncbi:MAG: GTP-binding protein [Candidatus Helarchaeota archaeon]|nr:GTP-binding protein [Candidatus Helarchaeota archaeon]